MTKIFAIIQGKKITKMHETRNFHINYLKTKQIKFVYQKGLTKLKVKMTISANIFRWSGKRSLISTKIEQIKLTAI
jgi:hypothetical protein